LREVGRRYGFGELPPKTGVAVPTAGGNMLVFITAPAYRLTVAGFRIALLRGMEGWQYGEGLRQNPDYKEMGGKNFERAAASTFRDTLGSSSLSRSNIAMLLQRSSYFLSVRPHDG
jgi:hypothetical protein